MKKNVFICFIASLLFFHQGLSQAKRPKVKKVETGQSFSSNKVLEKKLDSIFADYKKNTPGLAITILQNGKLLAKKAYGMASLEFNVPFSHNTVVRMPYSEGREFISIAAALMEKEGKLHFNDKLRKYFPHLPQWSEEVTIQDLLNHSSGLADEWANFALTQASMANRLDKSKFLQLLYNQPAPSVEPGKGYLYSNSDYGLLRLIMEKASGEDLAVYMNRKVFVPLGMHNSGINNDKEEVIPNHALNYEVAENDKYKLSLQDKTSPGGNYFVITTAKDLEKWAAAHQDPKSFISAAVKRLKQNARVIPVLPGTNYVFGHKLRQLGNHEAIVHMGVGDLSYLAYVPENKLTIIMTSNLFLSKWNLMKQVLAYLLGFSIPVVEKPDVGQIPIEPGAVDVSSFAGNYKWIVPLTYQSFVPRKRFTEFIAAKGVLRVVYGEQDTLDLLHVGKNTFRTPDFPEFIVFSQAHADSSMKLVLHSYDGSIIHMERMGVVKQKIEKKQLQKLTGKYYSKHLDFYWTLLLNEDDQLVVKRPTISDKILQPSADGDFRLMTEYGPYSSESWIRFYFNDKGEVIYFTVNHPRLMDHRFEKVE